MQEDADQSRNGKDKQGSAAETRPQQAGEGGTTRFGMEDGDNTDTPATGLEPDQQSGGD